MRIVRRRRVCAVLALLLSLSAAVLAQSAAQISGTIRLEDGTPAAGSVVVVRSDVTGEQHVAQTDERGHYEFAGLTPQSYVVEATRLKQRAQQKIALPVGQTLQVDLILAAPPLTSWQLPQNGTLLALIVGVLLTLTVTQLGNAILKKIGRPFTWLKNATYQMLAPRFPEWIGLRGYRKRVARSHLARLENPVGPQDLEIPVEQAFVPLRLIGDDRDERIDVFPFVAQNRRLMILGGAGTGKTTLMKSLVIGILGGKGDPVLKVLVPVFVVLRDMAAANQTVDDAILSAFAQVGFKSANRFVDAALASGRMLIILDGLDEVGINREIVASRIRDFCRRDDIRSSPNHVVVTCREASYTAHDLDDVLKATARVEPFAPQHMLQFLQGWPSYKGKAPLSLYGQIQGDPQVLDTCRNPLLLTILTGLYLSQPQFDLPSSRDRFYEVSLDELLFHRPSRRSIVQAFAKETKWAVLETAALDRLETVKPDEDPELLGRARLAELAKPLLGQDAKDADTKAFIKELVEVNGVVRPAADGMLVFGHRTFQEYLAAREVAHTKKADTVVEQFTKRPELVEVLCFFCGRLHNKPDLRRVLEQLIAKGEPTICARALLNVTEPPPEELVAAIVAMLPSERATPIEHLRQVELLGSLSQRRGESFAPAKSRFSTVVSSITGTLASATSATTAGAIAAALSTNPELADSLAPGMVESESPAVRAAGVQLLHDLGTDKALDALIRLLGSKLPDVRVAASAAVADLVESRYDDLLRMAVVLPERIDRNAWPFEEYLPGRLVLPMVEALSESGTEVSVANEAIAEAIAQRSGRRGESAKLWRHAPRDRQLNRHRQNALRILAGVTAFAIVLSMLGLTGLKIWCSYQQKVALVQLSTPRVQLFEGSALADLRDRAGDAVAEIDKAFPSHWSLSYLLHPLVWGRASVPESLQGLYKWLRACAGKEVSVRVDSVSPADVAEWNDPGRLTQDLRALRVDQSIADAVRTATIRAARENPLASGSLHIWIYKTAWADVILAAVFELLMLGLVIATAFKSRLGLPDWTSLLESENFVRYGGGAISPFLGAVFGQLGWTLTIRTFLPVCIVLSGFLVLIGIDFPQNPYMRLIDQRRPVMRVRRSWISD